MWWYRHGGTTFRRTRRDNLSRRAGDLFLPLCEKRIPTRRGSSFIRAGANRAHPSAPPNICSPHSPKNPGFAKNIFSEFWCPPLCRRQPREGKKRQNGSGQIV